MTDFVLTGLHEQEHPATDVVEYLVWKLHSDGQIRGCTLTDLKQQCVFLEYEGIRKAVQKLIFQGRIQVRQGKNERAKGRKFVSRYFPGGIRKPRILQ